MGSGFSKMKKQARLLQEQFSKAKADMESLRVLGSAGNGLVEITLNGEKELLAVSIKPECVDPSDIEGLQDLILAAYRDAAGKVEAQSPEKELMGSMPLGLF